MSEAPDSDKNKSQFGNKQITYKDFAAKLLEDRFLLTALELHTELLESGREIKQLKDFFSNPGNFELQTQEISTRLSRSGSQVTLDSLDLTRYSEDGAGTDERVAVLEFELRKAKETINALRNNLTVATESETSTPDKGSLRNISSGVIKPHEQRALNFLINEYLLLNEYKLTSITFADENQSQDFDDWDDVGLNIAKPPELISLYREGLKQSGQNTVGIMTQTDFEIKDEKTDLIKQMETEIEKIRTKVYNLEIECRDLKNLNLDLLREKSFSNHERSQSNDLSILREDISNMKDLVGSDSPERFEIIDKSMLASRKQDMEDTVSNSSFNVSDWTALNIPTEKDNESLKESRTKEISLDIVSKETFLKEVFSLCYINIPNKAEIDNILNNTVTNETLVHIVSHSLLKIIPNIIINKREEAMPLLISAIYLNPKATERDKLLQQLFNLKKKPSETERMMILSGIVAIAKCSGENFIENEILPQCWLQLTHKYVERKLLVGEACTALIPYVSSPIRNSLILSMLQQMLEDKEETVRQTVIKALALLFSLCEDPDKYHQCEQLALNTLNDSSNSIVHLSTQILFPVLSKWALAIGFLSSSLLKRLLHKLNDYVRDTESTNKVNTQSNRISRIISVIENLLPFLLMSAAFHDNVLSNIEKDMAVELKPDIMNMCTSLTNPEVFFKSSYNCGMILYEFDKYISENPNTSWSEMDWVVDMMLPDLFNNLHHIEITQQSVFQSFMNLFSRICIIFGINFTRYKIRPLLQKKIQNLEQVISSFNQFCPSLNIIPVYLMVLSYCCEFEELGDILKKFLCALPLCGAPLDCLEVTIKKLCEEGMQEIVVDCLWAGVVHQRPLVKSATATLFSGIIGVCSQELLKNKVSGAIVTLASDNDLLVRTATIPALGSLITDCTVKEIHDKAYMQLQTYMNSTSLKENHTFLRQLIVTLGNIVNSCTSSFRNKVILPQLTALSMYMSQMENQTRKIDMALALLEAFTNVVYSPLNKQSISSVVKPGLKCLESVICENQSLLPHQDVVLAMIAECDNKVDLPNPQSSVEHSSIKLSQNVNQGVEEMRQRVSKIFNKPTISKPNNLPNLQGIFKKK